MNRNRRNPRRAITLVELLMAMIVMVILAAMSWGAMIAAASQAKIERTRSIVHKIDQLIMAKWDGYRTRQLPIKIASGTQPRAVAQIRWMALMELMRMELPNSQQDILKPARNNTLDGSYPSWAPSLRSAALRNAYVRRIDAIYGANSFNSPPMGVPAGDPSPNWPGWTQENESAECLYLILACMRDGDTTGLDFLSADEIGDTDGDGMLEILDTFGKPILFVRWPHYYLSDLREKAGNNITLNFTPTDPITPQRSDFPDPFDPLHVASTDLGNPGAHWNDKIQPHMLRPLIFSGGPDKIYAIVSSLPSIAWADVNDPFVGAFAVGSNNVMIGQPFDIDGTGAYADNITNHDIQAQ